MSSFWKDLRDFANRINLDSVTVGPASLSFSPKVATDHFKTLCTRARSSRDKSCDVFVVSAHNMDEITQVDQINRDHESEALSTPLRLPGGSGANTAYALSRLGANVSISGAIGEDPDGERLISSLKDAGVDTEPVLLLPSQSTGRTTTLVEQGGERFIVVHPGVNSQFAESANADHLASYAAGARIIHLSSFVGSAELELQQRLLERIEGHALVSLTPGALYAKRGLDRLKGVLRHVDIMFIYKKQLSALLDNSSAPRDSGKATTQDLLQEYYAWRHRNSFKTPQVTLVKDPMRNSFGHIDQKFISVGVGTGALDSFLGPIELPANARITAIDTTGIGDAAAAGFLYGVLQDASVEDCVDSAFLLACFASTRLGARTAFGNVYEDIASGGSAELTA